MYSSFFSLFFLFSVYSNSLICFFFLMLSSILLFYFVYVRGCGESGQLGHNKLESDNLPRIIESLLPNVVGHISCGEHHSLSLASIPHSSISSDILNWKLIEDAELKLKQKLLQDIPNGLKSKHILEVEQERKIIIRTLAEQIKKEKEEKNKTAQEKIAMITNRENVMKAIEQEQKEEFLATLSGNSFNSSSQLPSSITFPTRFNGNNTSNNNNNNDNNIHSQPESPRVHRLSLSAIETAANKLISGELDAKESVMNNEDNDRENEFEAAQKRKYKARLSLLLELDSKNLNENNNNNNNNNGNSNNHNSSIQQNSLSAVQSTSSLPDMPNFYTTQSETKSGLNPSASSPALIKSNHSPPSTANSNVFRSLPNQSNKKKLTALRPASAVNTIPAINNNNNSNSNDPILSARSLLSKSQSLPSLDPSSSSSSSLVTTSGYPINTSNIGNNFSPLGPRIAFMEQSVKQFSRVKNFVSTQPFDPQPSFTAHILKLKQHYNNLKNHRNDLEKECGKLQNDFRSVKPSVEEVGTTNTLMETTKNLNMKLVTLNTRLMEAEENKKNYELYIIRMKEEDLQLSKQIDYL